MLIDFKGKKIGQYYFPPFSLSESEIVVINLCGGAHFYQLKEKIIKQVTRKLENNSIYVYKPVIYIGKICNRWLVKMFCPPTVGAFLRKYANHSNCIANNIYKEDYITPNSKLKLLSNSSYKLLSLYVGLSHYQYIIFDFVGIHPKEAQNFYALVKDIVSNGGAAILIDSNKEMKNDCTKYIEIEVKK